MNYGQVRASFLRRLNRDDCDNALADGFLDEGMRRVLRDCRLPSQERVVWFDATTQPIETIQLPVDYIEQIELTVDNEPLTKTSYRGLSRYHFAGAPRAYARYGNTIYLRGRAPQGSRVELLYYGAYSPLADDSAENEWTAAFPDVVIYAALSSAGDHFAHEKMGDWEARYITTRDALQNQAQQDEWSGGPMAVRPLYYEEQTRLWFAPASNCAAPPPPSDPDPDPDPSSSLLLEDGQPLLTEAGAPITI